MHDFTALNEDLEDMLALLSFMDDYVCVSNTNFHLRAVRGRVGRVLVPNPPEFRWMAEGEESPWFPGCKVYRQRLTGRGLGRWRRSPVTSKKHLAAPTIDSSMPTGCAMERALPGFIGGQSDRDRP